jgi:nitroreductase
MGLLALQAFTCGQLNLLREAAILRRMTQLNDRSSLLAFLKSRKSASAKAMTGPGPSRAELNEMLAIATRVPDHGKLAPWRFIVFEGDARGKVGQKFAARWAALNPSHGADTLRSIAAIFEQAPVVVAVVSTAAVHPKIPVWEQQLSAAAVCFNLELACAALGYDAQWNTDWITYDADALKAMSLGEHEKVAGLIYIGHSALPLEDRPRPDVAGLVTYWS